MNAEQGDSFEDDPSKGRVEDVQHPGEASRSPLSEAVGRRWFLKATLSVGAVLSVGCTTEQVPPPALPTAPSPSVTPSVEPASSSTFVPNQWIKIAPDNTITVVVDKAEMGQGIETSLPMLVAEELECDFQKIAIELAPVAPEYKNPIFGSQGTGGSTSIRGSFTPLRKAGAAARQMLLTAAAAHWSVDVSTVRAEMGEVFHPPSNRRTTFGSLTDKAAKVPVPPDPKLKAPSEYKVIGTPVRRINSLAKSIGKLEYASDVVRPNMLVAKITRSPVFGGKPSKVDSAAALLVKGVKKVVTIQGGVAVVAEHFWAAKKGEEALKITWDAGPNVTVSSDKLREAAVSLAKKPGAQVVNVGDTEKALKKAAKTVDAVYDVPYQAHATMEPMSAVAFVSGEKCEIWIGTQSPESLQKAAAAATGLPLTAVAVHSTYLGGGFGRRFENDFALDALEIAREMKGIPIKVLWSREDDMRHDFYRPASYNVLRGGVDKDGNILGWTHRVVSPSIRNRVFPSSIKNGIDRSSVEGAADPPYNLPNLFVDYHMHDTGVPVGFWRSVGHSIQAFVVESFFDELCALTKKDPFEMRKSLMSGAPRLKAVLELAAQKAGWGAALPEGKGRGIACHASFGSYVAQVAEVSVAKNGQVTVERVVCAADCGMIVNPDTLKAQMEGAMIYGLTATLKSEITVTGGKVDQSNFHNFKLLRMDECPKMEVHLVSSTEEPGGAGEPGTPPIAAAVANAIFAATGKRVRRLPVNAADLKKA